MKSKKDEQLSLPLCTVKPGLVRMMRKPLVPIRIAVVDDSEVAIAGVISVLLKWPNVFTAATLISRKNYPDIQEGRDDIVLLGEDMSPISGTAILERLREDGFEGVTASITSDSSCPSAFRYHFPGKYDICRSAKIAGDFIVFMNELVYEAEKHRLHV